MALLQISEPGQSAAPHQHRHAAGIDLGTTNSLVATARSGLTDTLPDHQGQHLLPSVVRYLADEAPIVGSTAKSAAEGDPLNTIISAKRLMGRGVEDVKTLGSRLPYNFIDSDSGMPRLRTAAGDISPVEVSAEILKTLRARVEESLGGELTGVVLTVPAYFGNRQKEATRTAGRLAELARQADAGAPQPEAGGLHLVAVGEQGVVAVAVVLLVVLVLVPTEHPAAPGLQAAVERQLERPLAQSGGLVDVRELRAQLALPLRRLRGRAGRGPGRRAEQQRRKCDPPRAGPHR